MPRLIKKMWIITNQSFLRQKGIIERRNNKSREIKENLMRNMYVDIDKESKE